MRSALVSIFSLALVGCSSHPPLQRDARADSISEAVEDRPDAPPAPDAAPEVELTPDAAPDLAPDLPPETAADAPPDTAADASPAALCTSTGGAVTMSLCCQATNDFPNGCAVGACACAPANSHQVTICQCPKGCYMPGRGCVGPTCTVGADQTCNDNPIISSIHGKCQADGTCTCTIGGGLNPATGKCL